MGEVKREVRRGRFGSKWYNERPGAKEVADWFKTIPLHDGMRHEDYINGITLIPNKPKEDEVVGYDDNGVPQIREVKHLVFTPYVGVDMRIAYWWRLMANHPDWMGVIEPVEIKEQSPGLPPGFFRFSIREIVNGQDRTVNYVGCSMRARILERESVEFVNIATDAWGNRRHLMEGKTILDAPHGSKTVPVVGRYADADHFSLMKAETGAIGRALGMAGMLTIGSGVSTSEDMAEVVSAPEAAPPGLPSVPAAQVEDPDALREALEAALKEMEGYPTILENFRAWVRERGFESLEVLSPAQTKGALKKAKSMLEGA
jgi:hypothetical protein